MVFSKGFKRNSVILHNDDLDFRYLQLYMNAMNPISVSLRIQFKILSSIFLNTFFMSDIHVVNLRLKGKENSLKSKGEGLLALDIFLI